MGRSSLKSLLFLVVVPAVGAQPAVDWSRCADAGVLPPLPMWEGDVPVNPQAVDLFADQADLDRNHRSTLRGDVRVLRGGERFHGDTVVYERELDVMDVVGGVQYWGDDLYVSATRAHYEFTTGEGWFDQAHYRLGSRHGRGGADSVRFGEADVLLMEQATYTTCDPGDEDWRLDARHVVLDQESEVGVARDVKLTFKGVPVFYSPYMSFPLSDERKSGFLAPGLGNSEETGTEVTVPYYWNIAPDRDATLGVRAMSERGAMFQGQYRYLVADGVDGNTAADGEGLLEVEFLPDDDRFGDDRSLFKFAHRDDPGTGWYMDINYEEVSDPDYFDELGTSLAVSSNQYLRRWADMGYVVGGWSLFGRLQDFQTVDAAVARANRPYRQLPFLRANYLYPGRDPYLKLRFDSEYVAFDQDLRVEGSRLDLAPSAAYEFRTPGTFVIPKVTLRHTRYDLNNTGAGQPANPSRTLPLFSLDNGLFFERDLVLGGAPVVQTLEPRLFYLYVPERDQDELPLFDTGEYRFDFAQLFREDRFSGPDRVGDTNQVSLAVTSRLVDPLSGHEWLRGSIGQIYYLRDRYVTSDPTQGPAREDVSDVVAEVAAELASGWRLRMGAQWSTQEEWVDRGTVQLRYQPRKDAVVNLNYRFLRDPRDSRDNRVATTRVEQLDLSGRWPVNPRFALVGRWNYDLPFGQTLEAFAGLEYETCCWAVRAVARRYLSDVNRVNDGDVSSDDYNTGVFLQFELKGLAGIGRGAGAFLEQQIPGYENSF